jgi:3-hydroxyisobutyrate dehydrogenase-like beta-hydroxyacid dehydrogenase
MSSALGVTVVGAGAMGSAIARALLNAGHAVTVWNRTPEKVEPLRAAGAGVADTLAAAVGSNDVTVMCVADQAAVAELMDVPRVTQCLRERTLVQFTTSTAADSRRGKALAQARGIGYVSGALMAYPRSIGTPEAVILCAGKTAELDRCGPVLNALGTVRRMGVDPGRPAAAEAALIAFFYGTLAGFLHGAVLARKESIAMGEFLELARPLLREFIAGAIEETGQRLLTGDYSEPQSSLRTHLGGIDKLVIRSSEQAGVEHEVMSAIKNVVLRGIERGRAGEDIASLVDVLLEE